MTRLRRIWTGMLTQNTSDSGTDSSIMLTVSQEGIERLQLTFRDTPQSDQEQGHANLYEIGTARAGIVPENLNNSSIRVAIRGDDAWCPEHIVVWGERFSNREIIPLAIETDINTALSTDSGEGNISLPLRRVGLGNKNMQINRLLTLMTTANRKHAGTDGTVNLRIVSGGNLVVDSNLNMPVDDREKGDANFYFSPVITSFSKSSLNNSSIRLTIQGKEGDDAWLPESFFLFGLDDSSGRPESLIPLVHLRTWPHGQMSTESSEGRRSVNLELVR